MPLSLETMEVQLKGDQWNKRFRTVQVYSQKHNFHIPFLFFNTKYVYYIILCLIWKLFLLICLPDRAIGLKWNIYRAIFKTFRTVNVWDFLVWQLNSMIVSCRLYIFFCLFLYICFAHIFFSWPGFSKHWARRRKGRLCWCFRRIESFRIKKRGQNLQKTSSQIKKRTSKLQSQIVFGNRLLRYENDVGRFPRLSFSRLILKPETLSCSKKENRL